MAHKDYFLKPNETLKAGEYLRSKNGLFHAVMQEDSNFVVYRGDWTKYVGPFNTSMWNILQYAREACGRDGPKAGPYYITMQSDGNLVIYGEGARPFWAISGFKEVDWGRNKNGWAVLADDGNFFVAPDGEYSKRVWSTEVRDTIDLNSVEFESVEYDLTPGHVTITRLGPPRTSMSEICSNETSVEQKLTIKMAWQKAYSESFKSTTTLKLGAKTTLSTGIPKIVEGKVELSTELTQAIEWGKVSSDSETIDATREIRVPPHTKVQGRCVWYVSKITVPFKCLGTAKFNGFSYGRIPIHLDGVYEGTQSHDVVTSWADITAKEPDLRFWKGEARMAA